MEKTMDRETRVTAAKDQVSCDLAGEVAILNIKSGIYYGLDEVGSSVWDLIQQTKTVAEVRDALLQEYDVDAETCERDLIALLRELSSKELIEIG